MNLDIEWLALDTFGLSIIFAAGAVFGGAISWLVARRRFPKRSANGRFTK